MNPVSGNRASSPRPTLSDLLRPLTGAVGGVERPDGTRLHVVEAGTGPDVLLVHGFGMNADAWSLVQPALVEQGRRVVAYDSRGHGRSGCGSDGMGASQLREDLRAVAEKYDLRDATIVCHSMGNFVALGLLPDETFRNRFRRAVLVSPTTGNTVKNPVARVQGPMMRMGLVQRLARFRPVGARLAAASLGPEPTPEILEATRVSLAAIPDMAVHCLKFLLGESVEGALADMDLPARVLTGTDDATTPSQHAELIVARAKQARIDYLAGAGHMLNWEAPEDIVRAVLEEAD